MPREHLNNYQDVLRQQQEDLQRRLYDAMHRHVGRPNTEEVRENVRNDIQRYMDQFLRERYDYMTPRVEVRRVPGGEPGYINYQINFTNPAGEIFLNGDPIDAYREVKDDTIYRYNGNAGIIKGSLVRVKKIDGAVALVEIVMNKNKGIIGERVWIQTAHLTATRALNE